jgi:hypothetical protein
LFSNGGGGGGGGSRGGGTIAFIVNIPICAKQEDLVAESRKQPVF